MKNYFLYSFIFFLPNILFCQEIISGNYGEGLQIAYNSETNEITGFYENYTGWDEATNSAQFSCTFYIEGFISDKESKIMTYYPNDRINSVIEGTLAIKTNQSIAIILKSDPGGCWNVEHFTEEPVQFALEKKSNWMAIKYITTHKSYFHNEKSNAKKQKAYVIKGDIVYVEQIEEDWAFCNYISKNQKITSGWLLTKDLNSL